MEIYNYGKKIRPKQKITGQEKWNLFGSSKFPDPDNFTIFEGQLENIREQLNEK